MQSDQDLFLINLDKDPISLKVISFMHHLILLQLAHIIWILPVLQATIGILLVKTQTTIKTLQDNLEESTGAEKRITLHLDQAKHTATLPLKTPLHPLVPLHILKVAT